MRPLSGAQYVIEVEQELARCANLISELTQKLPSFGPRRFAEALSGIVETLRDLFNQEREAILDLPDEETRETCKTYLYFINDLHRDYIPYIETIPAALIPSRLQLSILSHVEKLTGKHDLAKFGDIRFIPLWETNYGFSGLKEFPKRSLIDFRVAKFPSVKEKLNAIRAPTWFVFLHYPWIHARNVLFYPLLYHETAHFWDLTKQFSAGLAKKLRHPEQDLKKLFDSRIPPPSPKERRKLNLKVYRDVLQLTTKWLGEIVCDLVATHHCGPAYFMALLEFTTRVEVMRLDSPTHPGADLRLWFILKTLGNFRRKVYHSKFKKFLAAYTEDLHEKREPQPNPQKREDQELYQVLYRTLLQRAKLIIASTQEKLLAPAYHVSTFNNELPRLVNSLKDGNAMADCWTSTTGDFPNSPFATASILNAAWVVYFYHRDAFASLFDKRVQSGTIMENLTDLASQALDGAETLRYWREFKAKSAPVRLPGEDNPKPLTAGSPPTPSRQISADANRAVPTRDFIVDLLRDGRQVVSPLLDPYDQLETGSINLRIGTNIITTKRTERGSLRPANLSSEEIAFFQEKVSYTFGQRFVLHPLELVLASTFEFIALPTNMSAFVITRSRYGRLGLIVATATYVHPNWKGCLTLEMVNYGTVPIELECGAAVAQLILLTAQKSTKPDPVRKIPVQPEFSVTKHPDWDILKKFRYQYGLPDSNKISD